MKGIISDTGALISLEKMRDGYALIQRLYQQLIVPPQVLKEVSFHFPNTKAYLKRYGIEHFVEVKTPRSMAEVPGIERLDLGEIEAISLALELRQELLIEEREGRKIAKNMGLPISGIGGQVLKALEMEMIDETEALGKMQELFEHRRLDAKTYKDLRAIILA